MIVEPHSI